MLQKTSLEQPPTSMWCNLKAPQRRHSFLRALKHEKLLRSNPTPMHLQVASSMSSRLYTRKNTGSWNGKVVGGPETNYKDGNGVF